MASHDDYYAAIPWSYIDLLHSGDATGCMLCTYVILHRMADWATGKVKHISAQGLATWSQGAFNADMLRMERQNHITREIISGSHKSYAVGQGYFVDSNGNWQKSEAARGAAS